MTWIIWIVLVLALVSDGIAQQPPFTLETDTELSSAGDFDGDGHRDLVVIDRETGAYRIFTQAGDGSFSGGVAKPTGVAAPTALGVGRLAQPGRDTLAVTAPAWNRVQLVDPAAPQPQSAAQGGLGPVALAVLDLPGPANDPAIDDLMVASGDDSPPERDQISLLRVQAGAATAFEGITPAGAPLSHGRSVRLKSGGPALGGFVAEVPGSSEFRAYENLGGGITVAPAAVANLLTLGSDYAFGFFDPASPLAQFLFYLRGDNLLELRWVTEPSAGQFEMTDRAVFDLGAPIHLVSVVEHGGGARILVLFDGGASAELFDFDAASAPVSRQVFTPPPGEAFTSATGLGGDLLLTSGIGGKTTRWLRYDLSGASHVLSGGGTAPAIDLRPAASTVFVFAGGEPFVDPGVRLTRLLKAGDWTSAVASAGGNLSATALSFADSQSGLGGATNEALGSIAVAELAQPNQYSAVVSLATVSALAGALPATVSFAPPPGRYDSASIDPTLGFLVSLRTSHPGGSIFYRLAPDAAWQAYGGPVKMLTDTTIEAFAGVPFAGEVTPIASGRYTFSAQPALASATDADLDGDGLGDAWEKAFGVSEPGDDDDGDLSSNWEEQAAGSDPRDPSSVPTRGGDLLLFLRAEPDGAGSVNLVLAWPDNLVGARLQASPDLVGWLNVVGEITQTGGFFEWRTPVGSRMFFRLAR